MKYTKQIVLLFAAALVLGACKKEEVKPADKIVLLDPADLEDKNGLITGKLEGYSPQADLNLNYEFKLENRGFSSFGEIYGDTMVRVYQTTAYSPDDNFSSSMLIEWNYVDGELIFERLSFDFEDLLPDGRKFEFNRSYLSFSWDPIDEDLLSITDLEFEENTGNLKFKLNAVFELENIDKSESDYSKVYLKDVVADVNVFKIISARKSK